MKKLIMTFLFFMIMGSISHAQMLKVVELKDKDVIKVRDKFIPVYNKFFIENTKTYLESIHPSIKNYCMWQFKSALKVKTEEEVVDKFGTFLLNRCLKNMKSDEAQKILKNEFNDEANKKECARIRDYMTSSQQNIDEICVFLIMQIEAKEIKGGLELEFAKQVLKHYEEVMKKHTFPTISRQIIKKPESK